MYPERENIHLDPERENIHLDPERKIFVCCLPKRQAKARRTNRCSKGKEAKARWKNRITTGLTVLGDTDQHYTGSSCGAGDAREHTKYVLARKRGRRTRRANHMSMIRESVTVCRGNYDQKRDSEPYAIQKISETEEGEHRRTRYRIVKESLDTKLYVKISTMDSE
jgi:hypothetical protein